jgi:3-oxoacyl-[acyl-carrier-protein] synthase-3
MSSERIAITGVGYATPAQIRTNDDSVFDWLKQHQPAGMDLFQGYNERRVLAPEEDLMDIMMPAAQQALDSAGLDGKDVDILLGCASVGDYITPNALARVHAELKLPSRTWVIPTNDEYESFLSGTLLANALVQSGWARNVLIVCGCNWTRHVSYQTPQSISAADGAGAAVLSHTWDGSRFALVDAENDTQSQYYGTMYMQGVPIEAAYQAPSGIPEQAYSAPFFQITPAGQQAFKTFGVQAPVDTVNRLLKRNGLSGADIALIGHQASSVLIDAWNKAIQPAQYLDTLATFANMTLATIPVNLAALYDQIAHDYLVLMGLGTQLQTSALLLRRNG